MVAEVIDPTALGYLVEKFGFPIGVSILLLCVITTLTMLIVKSTIERQKLMDSYYFKNLDKKLDEHSELLRNTSGGLTAILLEMKCVSLKSDECIDRIDDLESKSMVYIFGEGKISRIKNNQEIDVTTQIINQ